MNPTANARRLRRDQTKEEKQLWRALRAGRFAGFKFRRQHPMGEYTLDFYCPLARLTIELDGFGHGLPRQIARDIEREKFLLERDIEELRFWNHQWHQNREGVLLEIQTYVPPPLNQLGKKLARKPPWETQFSEGRGM